jgi:2-oxoglutarate ferredoxin oxidoreductase subunit beta
MTTVTPQTLELSENEQIVYQRPQILGDIHTHYCPGCTHGVAHRLVAEVIEELEISGQTIMVAPVGCAVLAYNYLELDAAEAAHGRAPAMATGIKRPNPDKIVFTYQGDGDLASIGIAEVLHAAARGEKITVIFVNNAIYGMTGGQMAPTSVLGQITTSSPHGRDAGQTGYPLQIAELISSLPGTAYSVRRSLHDARHTIQAKKAIRKAFEAQMWKLGFSLVELLSICPTNWGMSPVDATDWLVENMLPQFPLGDYKVAKELLPDQRRARKTK